MGRKSNCPYCGASLLERNISRHIQTQHTEKTVSHKCSWCHKYSSTTSGNISHMANCSKKKDYNQNQHALRRKEVYFNRENKMKELQNEGWSLGTFTDLKVMGLNYEHANNVLQFSEDNWELITNQVMDKIKFVNKLMLILTFKCEFMYYDDSDKTEKLTLRHFDVDSETEVVNNKTELGPCLTNAIDTIKEKVEEIKSTTSKLILKAIRQVVAHITAFSKKSVDDNHNSFLNNAGSYIDIKHIMPKKKGILNIQNTDNKCLIWCIIAHFIKPDHNPQRVTNYVEFENCVLLPDNIDLSNLTENNFKKIEELNNIRLNVITLKDDINNLLKYEIKREIYHQRKQSTNISPIEMRADDFIDNIEDGNIILRDNYLIDDSDCDEVADEYLNNMGFKGEDDGVDRNLIQNKYAEDLFYPYRVSKYEIKNEHVGLNFDGHVIPYHTDLHNREINMLLVKEFDNAHLILINDMDKFFHNQNVCTNCFSFRCDKRSEHLMQRHKELCYNNDICKIMLPDVSKKEHLLRFKNFKNCHKLHNYVIADFETSNINFEEDEEEDTTATKYIKKMLPNSFATYYISPPNDNDLFSLQHVNDNDDLILQFIRQIKFYTALSFENIIKANDSISNNCHLTIEERQKHEDCLQCEYCLKDFTEEIDKLKKVLHHDHFTNNYIATVCASCNDKMKDKKIMPVIFHNGRGFDWQLFIKKISLDKDFYINVIPQSTEKFISFSAFMKLKTGKLIVKKEFNKETGKKEPVIDPLTGQKEYEEQYSLMEIRFLDSFQFMNASIESLVHANKLKTTTQYKNYDDIFKDFSKTFQKYQNIMDRTDGSYAGFNMLLQKGIYPYNFVDDHSKLNIDHLPDKKYFSSDLARRDKSKDDYMEDFWYFYYWNSLQPAINGETGLLSYGIGNDGSFVAKYPSFNQVRPFITRIDVEAIDNLEDQLKYIKSKLYEKLQVLTYDEIKLFSFNINYEHAQRVWKYYKCKTFKEYHDLYLTWDVLLLADIFENFRKNIWDDFGMEALQYYSLPGLSWDCMLKTMYYQREAENLPDIETLSDLDMILMMEKAQRGGICHSSVRSCSSYPGQTHILYHDATNLYGWAMSQNLPAYNYQWVQDADIAYINQGLAESNYNPLKQVLTENEDEGYFLEFDMYLHPSLHQYYNDYPLAPEHRKITRDELSPYQRAFDMPCNTTKLLCTLNPKEKYICHYENLLYYIEAGYTVTRVYRAFKFTQEPWLKYYIDKLTEQRNNAKTEIIKMIKKLSVNSIYGQLNKNLRKHFQLEMCNSANDAKRLIKKINYKGTYVIYDDNLVAIKLNQMNLKFKNPLSVAVAVLDLSKLHMYKFVYACKQFFDKDKEVTFRTENYKVVYTDTDSIVSMIRYNGNIYKDFILKMKDYFDLSVYSKNHEIFEGLSDEEIKSLMDLNKKKIGKFKDEMGNSKIVSWIGLRAKSYAYKVDNGDEDFKCKGISSTLYYDQFLETLNSFKSLYVTERKIRSEKHDLKIIEVNKKALSIYDDKRYIIEGKDSTLAFGNVIIPKLEKALEIAREPIL